MTIAMCYILLQLLFCVYIITISWIGPHSIDVSIATTVFATFLIMINLMLLVRSLSRDNRDKNQKD